MAIVGAGAKLQVSIASSYTDVAGVYDIGGPDITFDDIKVSDLQSANRFHEYLCGFGDGGEIQFELRFTGAQWATLYGLIQVVQAWRVLFSNGSKWDSNGYLKHLPTKIPLEADVTATCAIKVSGKPVFTA